MYNSKAYAALTQTSPLASFEFQRRDPEAQDVKYRFVIDLASLKQP